METRTRDTQIIVVIALLSVLAINVVWLRVAYVAVKALLKRGDMKSVARERAIFRSQLGAYLSSLLLGNLLSSVSYLINSSWVATGGVSTGECDQLYQL